MPSRVRNARGYYCCVLQYIQVLYALTAVFCRHPALSSKPLLLTFYHCKLQSVQQITVCRQCHEQDFGSKTVNTDVRPAISPGMCVSDSLNLLLVRPQTPHCLFHDDAINDQCTYSTVGIVQVVISGQLQTRLLVSVHCTCRARLVHLKLVSTAPNGGRYIALVGRCSLFGDQVQLFCLLVAILKTVFTRGFGWYLMLCCSLQNVHSPKLAQPPILHHYLQIRLFPTKRSRPVIFKLSTSFFFWPTGKGLELSCDVTWKFMRSGQCRDRKGNNPPSALIFCPPFLDLWLPGLEDPESIVHLS